MKLSLLLAISLTFGTIHGFTQTHKTPTAEQLQDSKDSIEDARTDSVHEAIDKAIDGLDDSTNIAVGLDVSNKSLYLGRAYGAKGILYNPEISFYHKSGFGFSAVNSVWLKSKTNVNITDLTLKYKHSFGDWWDFDIDYAYWIFDGTFPNDLGLNNQFETANDFTIASWLSATTDIVYMFGSSSGLLFQENISHAFSIYPSRAKERFQIEPEAGMYVGNGSVLKKRQILDANTALINKSFGILDYYAKLKLTYQVNKWTLGIAYQEDIPENPKKKKATAKPSKLKSVGYFTFSIKRVFTL